MVSDQHTQRIVCGERARESNPICRHAVALVQRSRIRGTSGMPPTGRMSCWSVSSIRSMTLTPYSKNGPRLASTRTGRRPRIAIARWDRGKRSPVFQTNEEPEKCRCAEPGPACQMSDQECRCLTMRWPARGRRTRLTMTSGSADEISANGGITHLVAAKSVPRQL